MSLVNMEKLTYVKRMETGQKRILKTGKRNF